MASVLVLAVLLGTRIFSARERALAKYGHVNHETDPVQGKGSGRGPA
jgi:hypothetical protein